MSRHDLELSLDKQSPRFQVIVEALEAYHGRHGRYPLSLDELSLGALPAVAVPKSQSTLRPSGPTYHVARDRSFFRISYGLVDSQDSDLHAVAVYFSPNRKWDLSGSYDVPFANVESWYYGELFRTKRTTEFLELTVASLLDAVRTNGTVHPCRNLWGDWIDRSLGSAQKTQLDFLPVPGMLARTYSPVNGGPSYVFVFREQLYPPMTKPLPIVAALYRSVDGKGSEWLLMQSCDSSA